MILFNHLPRKISHNSITLEETSAQKPSLTFGILDACDKYILILFAVFQNLDSCTRKKLFDLRPRIESYPSSILASFEGVLLKQLEEMIGYEVRELDVDSATRLEEFSYLEKTKKRVFFLEMLQCVERIDQIERVFLKSLKFRKVMSVEAAVAKIFQFFLCPPQNERRSIDAMYLSAAWGDKFHNSPYAATDIKHYA